MNRISSIHYTPGRSTVSMVAALFFLPSILAALVVNAQTAKPASNLARPIGRADFENRIWKLDVTPPLKPRSVGVLTSTHLLGPNPVDELISHENACETSGTCNVLTAGPGYITGYRGTKHTVEVRAPGQSVRHVALLPAFTTTEGLTHAVLALFSPKEVMPACYMPVGLLRDEKNRYIYGRWHIKAIHWINNEEYLVWLQAGGGDGGWHWQLQTFMTITSSCGEVNRVDYYVDVDPPETCKLSVPRLDGFFSVALDGKVVSRPVKKSCLGIRVERM